MGVADSPLKDRVVFVQGAPRSGTTWLVMLLATHPQIAGVEAESRLFEFGVDRLFDNFEGRDKHLRGLRTYVEREELVDVVRDLCDGVFAGMRSHVNDGWQPDFVVEKTPPSMPQASLDLRSKRERFPDDWYLHIVRDGDAVNGGAGGPARDCRLDILQAAHQRVVGFDHGSARVMEPRPRPSFLHDLLDRPPKRRHPHRCRLRTDPGGERHLRGRSHLCRGPVGPSTASAGDTGGLTGL